MPRLRSVVVSPWDVARRRNRTDPGCFAFSWGPDDSPKNNECYLVTNAIGDICEDLSDCSGECFSNPDDGSAIVESCDEFNLDYTDEFHQCYCRTAGPSN